MPALNIKCPDCGDDMEYYLHGGHWLICPIESCGLSFKKATIKSLQGDLERYRAERRKHNDQNDQAAGRSGQSDGYEGGGNV